MRFDLSPRVGDALVDLARPLGEHLLFREKGADAKGRATTALAVHAMTQLPDPPARRSPPRAESRSCNEHSWS
jgi:hypothetical protein